jgi:putative flippase GtrA
MWCRSLCGVTELQSTEPVVSRGIFARFEHLVRELGKFGVVGMVALAVDVGVFNALLFSDVNRLVAATISMTLAATLAFIGNRFWTWRDRKRAGLRREYTLYFLFNLVGLGIALGCLLFSSEVLGPIWPFFQTKLADNLAKNGVGLVLGTAFRFWSYRQIVFRKRQG